MRKLLLLLFLCSTVIFGQDNKNTSVLEATYFTGNVLPHTNDLYHLLGHPQGVMLSYSLQTRGKATWHKIYNYPDYGAYFIYQDFKNEMLGHNYAVGMHYNFYFLKRNLYFKIAQGIAYNTNPYDKENNSKNKALGTTLVSNTNFGLFYKSQNTTNKIGFQAGFLLTHYSNGRIKSPNSGINSAVVALGLNYNFQQKTPIIVDTISIADDFDKKINFNVLLRTGVNESSVIGSGQFPFYHIGAYASKRINRKSELQFGTELFLTTSFKEYIKFRSIAYPELNIDPNTDYKRIGIFVGHELHINKISLEAQLGYYLYDPFKNEIPVYDRLGIKYYITKDIYTGFSIKTHVFLAEALEFGIGFKL